MPLRSRTHLARFRRKAWPAAVAPMEQVSACPARLLERGASARRAGGGTSAKGVLSQVPSRAVAALLFCLLVARACGATRTARRASGGGEQAPWGAGGRGWGGRSARTLLQTCPAPGDALVATGDILLEIQEPLVVVSQGTAGVVRAERLTTLLTHTLRTELSARVPRCSATSRKAHPRSWCAGTWAALQRAMRLTRASQFYSFALPSV